MPERRKLAVIDTATLTLDKRLDREQLLHAMDAGILSNNVIKSWTKDADYYSSGVTNGAVVTNYCVQNTSFAGNIVNNGTISPGGIAFQNGTISGFIQSTGVINGGISLDASSSISSTTAAINITAKTTFSFITTLS